MSVESANPQATTNLGILFAIAVLWFVWGSTYLAIKVGLETFQPFPMLALRFSVAGGLLYGFLRLRGVPNPSLVQWRDSALSGVLLLSFVIKRWPRAGRVCPAVGGK